MIGPLEGRAKPVRGKGARTEAHGGTAGAGGNLFESSTENGGTTTATDCNPNAPVPGSGLVAKGMQRMYA